MSSELSRSSSPKWIAAAVALVLATVVIGCIGPDAFDRDAGPIQTGAGGNDGFAGQTGNGGSGMGGAAMGGQTGSGGAGTGGKTGTGGSGMGGAPGAGGRTGSGGSAMGGAPGTGGRGMGGATGIGGAVVTDGGSDGDAAGAGGMMGTGGADGGTVVFSDNFESYTVNTMPTAWKRVGGSATDWATVADTTQEFAQRGANSATFRSCYSTPGLPAVLSGATTLSAQVRVTMNGSSTPTTALVCVRYTAANDAACLALIPGMGVQIQQRSSGTINSASGVFPETITLGTQYSVALSTDSAGLLTASFEGAVVGTFMPTTVVASGFVAVATQNSEATFDNVVVTQP